MIPDLTSDVHPSPSDCFEYQFSDKASNCDSQRGVRSNQQPLLPLTQFADFRPMSEHYYEQPMVVFPPNQNSVQYIHEKTPFIKTSGKISSIFSIQIIRFTLMRADSILHVVLYYDYGFM